MTNDERILNALDTAVCYGGTDGSHHLRWVIDQMVRCLTGCDVDADGIRGETDEYRKLVDDACHGEDGPDTYEWDEGIPP